ncbi:MAG: hypothetical protein ABL970_03085 [Nitrospira sp.]
MWSLFPVHKPRIGISIRAHRLELVEVRHRWRRPPVVRRLVSRPLPAGLVAPSPTAANLTIYETVVQELRALCEGVRDRTVAVDLPLAAGTFALFHFETFPQSREEQDALVKWRFRQDEHVTATDLHVVSQVFAGQREGNVPAPVSVLAVAIRQSLLSQYHRLCDDAGLLPVSMGFSTLHLLELYRRAMPAHADVFFAHRTAEAMIVVALRHGRPSLLRVKPLRRTTVDLKPELLTTLQYFHSQSLHRCSSGNVARTVLYVLDDTAVARRAEASAATEVWTPTDDPDWAVEMIPVTWSMAPLSSSAVEIPDVPPFGALAGVVAS